LRPFVFVLTALRLYDVELIRGGGACLYWGLPWYLCLNIKHEDKPADIINAESNKMSILKYLRIEFSLLNKLFSIKIKPETLGVFDLHQGRR
jgi:hypothetical protein